MSREKLSRRELLVMGGATCAAGLIGCGSGWSLPADIPAGAATSFSTGSLTALNAYPVAVGRDAGGLYALSVICTHAGCDMSQDGTVSGGGLVCYCHGSVFSATGLVERGPAYAPLTHYAVSVDSAGQVTVHGDTEVSSSTRTQA